MIHTGWSAVAFSLFAYTAARMAAVSFRIPLIRGITRIVSPTADEIKHNSLLSMLRKPGTSKDIPDRGTAGAFQSEPKPVASGAVKVIVLAILAVADECETAIVQDDGIYQVIDQPTAMFQLIGVLLAEPMEPEDDLIYLQGRFCQPSSRPGRDKREVRTRESEGTESRGECINTAQDGIRGFRPCLAVLRDAAITDGNCYII